MTISASAQVWAHEPPHARAFLPRWTPLTLGDQLNAGAYGGTSSIHRISTPGKSHLVAKLFNEGVLASRRRPEAHNKLIFVARCSARLKAGWSTRESRVDGRPHIAWPEMLLYSEQTATPDKLVGFVMPAFHGVHPLQLLYTPKHRKLHFPTASSDVMLAVAAMLAAVVDDLHGGQGNSGILIADLTPRNILISPKWDVRIIDADSFQYTGAGKVHRTNESTPGHRSPKMARAALAGDPLPLFTRDDDAYALTIIIFHLLVDGAHPWRAGSRFEINGIAPDEEENMLAGRFPYAAPDRLHPPRIRLQTYQRLAPAVRAAFERTFICERPLTPGEWVRVIGRVRGQAFRPSSVGVSSNP